MSTSSVDTKSNMPVISAECDTNKSRAVTNNGVSQQVATARNSAWKRVLLFFRHLPTNLLTLILRVIAPSSARAFASRNAGKLAFNFLLPGLASSTSSTPDSSGRNTSNPGKLDEISIQCKNGVHQTSDLPKIVSGACLESGKITKNGANQTFKSDEVTPPGTDVPSTNDVNLVSNSPESREIVSPDVKQVANPFGPPLDLDTAKQRVREAYLKEVARKSSHDSDALTRNIDAVVGASKNFFELVQAWVPWPGSQNGVECSPFQFCPGVAANAFLHMSGEDAVRFGALPLLRVGPDRFATVAESTTSLYGMGLDLVHVLSWLSQLVKDNGINCLWKFFPAPWSDGMLFGLDNAMSAWFATWASKAATEVIEEFKKSTLCLLQCVNKSPYRKDIDLICRIVEKIAPNWPTDDLEFVSTVWLLATPFFRDHGVQPLGSILSVQMDGRSILQHAHRLLSDDSALMIVRSLWTVAKALPVATLLRLLVDDSENQQWMSFVRSLMHNLAETNGGDVPDDLCYALLDAVRGDAVYENALLVDFPPKDFDSLIRFLQKTTYRSSVIKRLLVTSSVEKVKPIFAALNKYLDPDSAMSMLEVPVDGQGPLAFNLSMWGAGGCELLMLLIEKAVDGDSSVIKQLESALLCEESDNEPGAFLNMALGINEETNRELALRALHLLKRLANRTMLFVGLWDKFGSSRIIAALLGTLFVGDARVDTAEAVSALFEFFKEWQKFDHGISLLMVRPYDPQRKTFLPEYAIEILLKHFPTEQKGELVEMLFAPRDHSGPLFQNMLLTSRCDKPEYNFAFAVYKLLGDAPDVQDGYVAKLRGECDSEVKDAIYAEDNADGWNDFVEKLKAPRTTG